MTQSIYPEIPDGDDGNWLSNGQLSETLSQSDLSFFDGPDRSTQANKNNNFGGPDPSLYANGRTGPRHQFPNFDLGDASETFDEAIMRLTGDILRTDDAVNEATNNTVNEATHNTANEATNDTDKEVANNSSGSYQSFVVDPAVGVTNNSSFSSVPYQPFIVDTESLVHDPTNGYSLNMDYEVPGEPVANFGSIEEVPRLIFDTSPFAVYAPTTAITVTDTTSATGTTGTTSAIGMTASVPAQAPPPVQPAQALNGTYTGVPDRKQNRVADIADPPCCPICFHMYTSTNGVKYHLRQFHNKTNAEINANPDMRDPKTLGHFKAMGVDTTYTGNIRKQVNARRRWDLGISSDTPEYWDDVYKKTPSVRAARTRVAKNTEKKNEKKA